MDRLFVTALLVMLTLLLLTSGLIVLGDIYRTVHRIEAKHVECKP